MKRIVTAYSLFGVVSATLVILTQATAAIAAAAWIAASLLGLAGSGLLVLAVAIGAPWLVLVVKVTAMCWRAETAPENN
jgi:hypothetical protein